MEQLWSNWKMTAARLLGNTSSTNTPEYITQAREGGQRWVRQPINYLQMTDRKALMVYMLNFLNSKRPQNDIVSLQREGGWRCGMFM